MFLEKKSEYNAFCALKTYMDRLEGVAKLALGVDIYKMPFDELTNVAIPKETE